MKLYQIYQDAEEIGLLSVSRSDNQIIDDNQIKKCIATAFKSEFEKEEERGYSDNDPTNSLFISINYELGKFQYCSERIFTEQIELDNLIDEFYPNL